MLQLVPQEAFPIVYVISDPYDTATYFCRAVIRNSVSGAIIQTVNLTDLGNRRFAVTVRAPDDPSGLGTHIDVTVSVYTDSLYTTKSPNYQEENTRYLIQQRWSMALGAAGGSFERTGGSTIDYKKIKEILLEAFNELPTTDIPEVDLTGLYAQGDSIRRLIEAIKVPTPKDVDLAPHTDAIMRSVAQLAKEIKATMPKIDFQPVLDAIQAIKIPEGKNYDPHFAKVQDAVKALMPKIEQYKKFAGFSKTLDGLFKEYGMEAEKPAAPAEKKPQTEYDPRVKALFD